MPSSGNPQIYMPWSTQGGAYLDPAIAGDFVKNDGWDLVYDSFNPNVQVVNQGQAGGYYFALYNRYRGILRYYLYIPSGNFGSSTNISHGLSVYSNSGITSKMLNFQGVDIVDANGNTDGFTQTSTKAIANAGGWYYMQYQIAYDPSFSNTTFPSLGFAWDSYNISVSNISLNGVEQGTANGTITTPKKNFDWAGAVLGVAEIVGAAGGFGDKTGFADAVAAGLSGKASGFLSGIFGGNSANSQEVALTINSNIKTTGTSTTSQPIAPNTFIFPGQTVTSPQYPAPLVNYPLGLFNLTGRPTINVHTTRTSIRNPSDPTIRINEFANAYTVDNNIFNSLLAQNPSVFNSDPIKGAALRNLRTEAVVINPNTDDNFSGYGNHETIGNLSVYTGGIVTIQYRVEHAANHIANQVAVRVSFNVVPNNGAPSSFIVKTFLADLVTI